MGKKLELQLSKALATYIKLQYPKVVFTTDSSGVRLTIGQATALKAQRSVHKIPDFIILCSNSKYGFMCLELKTKEDSPYLKNGELSKEKHIHGQNETLITLRLAGGYANFAVGIDDAKKQVDNYMKCIE